MGGLPFCLRVFVKVVNHLRNNFVRNVGHLTMEIKGRPHPQPTVVDGVFGRFNGGNFQLFFLRQDWDNRHFFVLTVGYLWSTTVVTSGVIGSPAAVFHRRFRYLHNLFFVVFGSAGTRGNVNVVNIDLNCHGTF